MFSLLLGSLLLLASLRVLAFLLLLSSLVLLAFLLMLASLFTGVPAVDGVRRC
jgi:hypothetical protein